MGRLAERYGKLPSEIVAQANSFDLMVTDVLATYDNYTRQKNSGELPDATAYGYSEQDLLKIKDRGKDV